MKKILVCFLLFCSGVHAQTFQQLLGGSNLALAGYNLIRTSDGGYLMTGNTGSAPGIPNANVFVVKTTAGGDTSWTRTFGGSQSDDGYFVAETGDKGYMVSGSTHSFGAGQADGYLLKLAQDGTLLWSKTYGGPLNDDIISVAPAFDGGFMLLGSTSSFGSGAFDMYVIRTDNNGDTLWTKTIGNSLEDNGLSMQQTTDSCFIISGYTYNTESGSADIFLLKLNKHGALLWSKLYGGEDTDGYGFVKQTRDGGYIITGVTYSFGATLDGNLYLIRTDKNGNLLWSQQYGGIGTDRGYDIQETTQGDFVVCGETYSYGAGHSDLYVLKTDKNGTLLWSKTYGGSSFDFGRGITLAADKGYLVSGHALSFSADNRYDVMLVRTDEDGNSGCNETNAATTASATATQVKNAAFLITGTQTRVAAVQTLSAAGTSKSFICNEAVSIKEAKGNNKILSVYPNPSSGHFTLSFTQNITKGDIIIHNMLGQKVYQAVVQQEFQKEINTGDMASGVYFLQLKTTTGTWVQKISIK